MKIFIVLITAIYVLILGTGFLSAQAVSDEARRYYDRGIAAMKLLDFVAAISEFEQVTKLAPTWPEAYYNLGLAREAAKKYADAVKSYREYLRLAPNAKDAAEIKSLINKMEYNVERENSPTIADIADICASFGNEDAWDIRFVSTQESGELKYLTDITRVGDDGIKIPKKLVLQRDTRIFQVEGGYQYVKIEGPIVKFEISVAHSDIPGAGAHEFTYEIEVLSKSHVKIKEYMTFGGQSVRDNPVIYECQKLR